MRLWRRIRPQQLSMPIPLPCALSLFLFFGSTASEDDPVLAAAEGFCEVFCARVDDVEVPFADLQAYFTPAVREALDEDRCEAALAPMRLPGEARAELAWRRDRRLFFRIAQGESAPWVLDLSFDREALIGGLYVRPAPVPRPRAELEEELLGFGGAWGLASLLLDADGNALELFEAYSSNDEERPFALGSTFKLWVLAELARRIGRGEIAWEDEIAIRDDWKSLPSGTMQDLPADTRVPVRRMAEQMIGISDNTATDHLLLTLGREAIEARLQEFACTTPALNRPFLTTRDMFLLKSVKVDQRARVFPSGKLGEAARAWAAASDEQQRSWRAGVEALGAELSPKAFQGLVSSYGIQSAFAKDHVAIEWFARPFDIVELCRRALRTELVDAATSAAFLDVFAAGNPQCMSPGIRRQGFKGGSETNVFALAAAVEGGDGRSAILCLARSDFGPLAAVKVPGETVSLFRSWLAELVERELPPQPALDLDLCVSPLTDLWFELRARGEAPPPNEEDLLTPAVAAMRTLGEELGSALAFGFLEGLLDGAADASRLRARMERELPELQTLRVPGGTRQVELRSLGLAVADALVEVEPRWRAEHWPARRNRLERRRLELEARLASQAGREALHHFYSTLGFATDGLRVPIYLTVHAGWPGGVTHFRQPGETGVSFVSLEQRGNGLILETVLHESIHALDVLRRGGTDMIDTLEARLTAAGLEPRAARAWVHTLFFVHAGDTVRSFLDPDHVDYGDAEAYYPKVGEIAEIERALWSDLRSGAVDREELIEALVEAASAR